MSEVENELNYVYLQCIKDKGKLRVRVTSPGYLNTANTQFPRAVRIEGRRYKVLSKDINLIETRGKFFYSVKSISKIIIIEGENEVLVKTTIDLSHVKIHTDENLDDCVICMDSKKNVVFSCGHFYVCDTCSVKVVKCPMCRQVITARINRSDFG